MAVSLMKLALCVCASWHFTIYEVIFHALFDLILRTILRGSDKEMKRNGEAQDIFGPRN